MSANSFGKLLTVTTFGESHGPAIGCVIDGCPPGMALSEADIQFDLDRRRPGTSKFVTQRNEPDQVEILSGVYEGKTTGSPIALLIRNTDQRSKDYSNIAQSFRPGHADYAYFQKYGIRDPRGGGRSSARLTAPTVAAGAVAKIPGAAGYATGRGIGKGHQQRRAPGKCQPARGVLDPCLRQPGFRSSRFRNGNWKLLAAAADRRKQSLRFVGNKDEQRLWNRFFKRFEKRIGGRAIHRLGGMDEHDANTVAMGSHVQKIIKGANLIDSDLLTRLLLPGRFRAIAFLFAHGIRLNQTEIRVIALRQPTASQTRPACNIVRTGTFAEQRICKSARHVDFSDPPRPRQQ